MLHSFRRSRRGVALLTVLGVLGLMAILAMTFLIVARLERRASQQRTWATRACFLARSGLEDAAARIAAGQEPESASSRYLGEDWNGNGTKEASEAAAELYSPGALDRDSCPVGQAQRASFWAGDPAAASTPALRMMEGRPRSYSGMLTGDAVAGGNLYTLKVTSGGFFVNGGDVLPGDLDGDGILNSRDMTAGAVPTYNVQMKRMLGALAEALDREDGVDNGLPLNQVDGERLIDNRPSGGWTGFVQIRDAALGGSQAKLDVLRPYLTLRSWIDKRVIAPNPPATVGPWSSWADIRLFHLASSATSRAPAFENVSGRIVGRAPVELSWARSRRPALLALMTGLSGVYLNEANPSSWTAGNAIGRTFVMTFSNTWIPTDDCHVAASALLACPGDLATWQEFHAFCDAIAFSGTAEQAQSKRDLLKANFNPNSDLNKCNPGPPLWKTADKSDLIAYSTEFSLLPVQPRELECIGRILGADGRILASRRLRADLQGPGVVRLSTQKEFVCDDLGDLDLPGDEGAFRLTGCPRFVSESQGISRTWGHVLDTSARYPSGWMDGSSSGAGLQSYPEPCYDTTPNLTGALPDPTATGLSLGPAGYDGNLQLATVETVSDDPYLVTAPPARQMLLARFDDGFDLDKADAGMLCVTDTSQVSTAELDLSLWDAVRPNTLHPDGAYCEAGHSPAWPDRGNAHPFHGVISFWVKPNHPGPSFRYHPWVMRTNAVDLDPTILAGGSFNQPFFFGEATYGIRNGLILQWEIGTTAPDGGHEHRYYTNVRPAFRRWNLATAYWDGLGTGTSVVESKNSVGRCVLNDGQGQLAPADDYPSFTPNYWWDATDITLDDRGGPHLLVLGTRQARDRYYCQQPATIGQGADATIDEFTLYDFGGATPTANLALATSTSGILGMIAASQTVLGSAAQLAATRYQEGRFYKEAGYRAPGSPPLAAPPGEAGSCVLAPIRLPAGALLRRLAWTWHRPASLPDDYAEIELLAPDAGDYLLPADPSACRSTKAPAWTVSRQEWDVGLPVPGAFRIRAVFRRQTAVAASIPILESPVLDDLTILYERPGGPALGAWTWE